LVILTAQRAREIASGSKSAIEKDDKDAVLALREIAAGKLDPEALREIVIKKNQNRRFIKETDGIDEADEGFSSDEIAESLAEMNTKSYKPSSAAFEEDEALEEDLSLEEIAESEEYEEQE
jgi:DNA-directed RNA polymerase subunit K/omega